MKVSATEICLPLAWQVPRSGSDLRDLGFRPFSFVLVTELSPGLLTVELPIDPDTFPIHPTVPSTRLSL